MTTMDAAEKLFPLAWRINDMLRLTPDGGVEFTGSQNDVEDFRETLHRLDPNFSRGDDLDEIHPARTKARYRGEEAGGGDRGER